MLKECKNKRIDSLITVILTVLSTKLQESRRNTAFQPRGPKYTAAIVSRIRRGNRLLKEESNYHIVRNFQDQIPKDFLVRFRNVTCRSLHDDDCKEAACGYFVQLNEGIASCLCPDEPILCKHIHAAIMLSDLSVEQWNLRKDSLKNTRESGKKIDEPVSDNDKVFHSDLESDKSDDAATVSAEAKAAISKAEQIMKETSATRLRALEELREKVPSELLDDFMADLAIARKQEVFFNSAREKARKLKRIRVQQSNGTRKKIRNPASSEHHVSAVSDTGDDSSNSVSSVSSPSDDSSDSSQFSDD